MTTRIRKARKLERMAEAATLALIDQCDTSLSDKDFETQIALVAELVIYDLLMGFVTSPTQRLAVIRRAATGLSKSVVWPTIVHEFQPSKDSPNDNAQS